jgi:alpha-tubulin suppressor-like RCC1 family protein
MDINKRLFRRLSEYFKDNIKLSFILPFNVIVITKDKFYQIDEHLNKTYSTIAYTNEESVVKTLIEKSIVNELCDKRVIDCKNSFSHIIALTFFGKVYSWGKNNYGVLGNGMLDEEILEPKLNNFLNDLNIIDIACGAQHSLVLTSNGDVYAWGWNKYGQTGMGLVVNVNLYRKKWFIR